MFIGSAERRLEKPECISPDTERQRARSPVSRGGSPDLGESSLRYSAIASVSHTLTGPLVRHGTRNEGESSRSSALVEGSSAPTICSSNSRPASLHRSQPRRDHEP